MTEICEMKEMTDIIGINELLETLPEGLQKWYYFSNVDEFRYENVFDDKDKFEYINNIEMVLYEYSRKYWIKMKLTDVSGLISFDTLNGFYSGLIIDDFGKNTERRYRFSSCEPDIDFCFYCRELSVELIYQINYYT